MLKPRNMVRDFVAYSFGLGDAADIYEGLARSGIPAAVIRKFSSRRVRFVRHVVRSTPVGEVLFVHVPKNAGTSIKQALYPFDPGHATVRYYQMIVPEILKNVDSMAIIRDPIDRFLSAFDFVRNSGGSHVPISRKSTNRLSRIATIDDFLDHLEAIAGNWFLTDHVARPQWWYIVNEEGLIAVKNLWIFSQNNKNLTEYLSKYGIHEIPVVNQTNRKSRELTVEQKHRVHRIYEWDFAIYDSMLNSASSSDLYLKPVAKLAI